LFFKLSALNYTNNSMTIYTIGHSTRALNEFIEILRYYAIELLIDVRSIPRSRHTPQFNGDTLAEALEKHGISYLHVTDLGGLRHAKADSINLGWHNTSFRGYADYMQTDEFERGITELLKQAGRKKTVIMCAEALPWRCHRSMIGDALLVRKVTVVDIFDKNKTSEETLTDFAKVQGVKITYPQLALNNK